MNVPLSFANNTGNYVKGYTSTNQIYIDRYPIIEIIDKCDIADFKLNTPIFVRIEPDYNDFAIYDSFTGIYSFGSTISEAKENFCTTLEDTYKFLLEDIENLSPINKSTLDYLEEILSRK